jgi:hypothetical protein
MSKVSGVPQWVYAVLTLFLFIKAYIEPAVIEAICGNAFVCK